MTEQEPLTDAEKLAEILALHNERHETYNDSLAADTNFRSNVVTILNVPKPASGLSQEHMEDKTTISEYAEAAIALLKRHGVYKKGISISMQLNQFKSQRFSKEKEGEKKLEKEVDND